MQTYTGTMAADQVVDQTAETTQAVVQAKVTAPGATASVVCGVIGFFVAGLILGCAAIGQASAAKKLIEEHPDQYTGGGMATTGMVLGVIDLIGAAVTIVVMMSR